MMARQGAGRFLILSGTGLVCMMLLVTLASASTFAGKTVPAKHPEKETIVPVTTGDFTGPVTTAPVPSATQTTDSTPVFSSPAVIAAGLGLVSAAIGAGVTLYTHSKKK